MKKHLLLLSLLLTYILSAFSQQIDAGRTAGSLDVSPTGSATYTVPIAVPPGIAGVVPQIALTYNSQAGGNGMAGYGWNISGMSAITRIPATKFHDGFVGCVKLDSNDRFALNGQRLILKSGTYGGNGAVYETENYSNLRVVSRGVSPYGSNYGPAYFEVYYPEGSMAVYGNSTDSRTQIEFAITYSQNPQGIKINYTYTQYLNTVYISEISYGTNNSNKIAFLYKDALIKEQGYVAGISITRDKLLSKIEVTGNATGYRMYQLTHTTLQQLSSIQELSGDGSKSFAPISFNYNSFNSAIVASYIPNLNLGNVNGANTKIITGDFNGNGTMNYILSPNTKDRVTELLEGASTTYWKYDSYPGLYEDIFAVSGVLSKNGNLLSSQCYVTVHRSESDGIRFVVHGTLQGDFMDYQKDCPTLPLSTEVYNCSGDYSVGIKSIKRRYLPGDFNGDGLADVLTVNEPISCESGSVNSEVNFVNLDRRIQSNFVHKAGELLGFYSQDSLYTGDCNGDGKTDMIQIKNGIINVYNLDANNNLTLLWKTTNSLISRKYPPLIGDYNGDGKTDLMLKPDYPPSPNDFLNFVSTGKGFNYQYSSQPFKNNKNDWYYGTLIQHHLIPNDLNGDGKTDMLYLKTETYDNSSSGKLHLEVFYGSGDWPFSFTQEATLDTTTNLKHYPIPLFLTSDLPNLNLQFGVLSNNAITILNFQKDLRKVKELKSISQDGILYNIDYKPLLSYSEPGYLDYVGGNGQIFPYLDIKCAPGLKVVNQLRRSFKEIETRQVFGYREAVSHSEGLGFLGFKEVVRSNWHKTESDPNKLYTISMQHPQLRGATIKAYTSKTPYLDIFNPNNYINRTTTAYKTQLLPNKVFVNMPDTVTVHDKLSGTTTTQTYSYDGFYNVTKELSNFSGAGTKTVDITYANNPSAGYFIGRPLIKKTTLTNASDSYTTEEQYTYTGFLPTQIKKKGYNTPFNTENIQYDSYGNVIQKAIVTASGSRTTSMQYDASGRFMTRSTDVAGMVTNRSFNASNGNLISQTNPFNQVTSYLYDSWGRLAQTTDYLGVKSYQTYEKSGSALLITEYDDKGAGKRTAINALGKTTEVLSKDVLGQIVGKAYEYDAYDRQVKESEPAIGGNYTQATETEYDTYGRIKKVTSFTGKTTNITYTGLTTTVNDGIKMVVTTKNAMGQTVSIQDPGGTITNTYYANGNLKSADMQGSVQSVEQDGWGRKTKLTDPSAGVYTYTYNDYGEVTQETTPKGSTAYTYHPLGFLLSKRMQGENTDMAYQYTYDPASKLLTSMVLSNADGNNASYTYTYDSFKRMSSTVEDNLHARFTKALTYDNFGRVLTEASEAKNKANNKTANRTMRHTYQNGQVKSLIDEATGFVIWDVTAINARGQVTTALLGDVMKETRVYDSYGLPQEINTQRIGANPAELMKLSYSFDAQRGNLNGRRNSAFNNWTETFTYDNLDRLTGFTDNNGTQSQTYDNRGRITQNGPLGNYVYSDNSYQQTGLKDLTAIAKTYYESKPLQQITYNAFKSPVEIAEQGKEKISFQYNAALGRSSMYYGGEQADKMLRRYRRHYSEDGSWEITNDLQNNTTGFVLYVGGDAYTASAIYKEEHTATQVTQNLYYLHRDYQGSILMITDYTGAVKEKRLFDAWGYLVKLTNGTGTALGAFAILDRGYTGHEHLLGVGLINMNARLYDPILHRFLAPDNFVQDPSNSQNFNRYGYVLNNPLKYTDKSGEFFLWTLITATVDFVNTALFKGGLDPTSSSARNNAWKSFDPTASWSLTNKAFKIDVGMFKGSFLQILSRFTWELPQTLLGHTYSSINNLFGGVNSVSYYGGATAVEGYGDPGVGFTLGSYVNGGRGLKADPSNPLFQHEYGHYLQSQASGLFYLGKYAIPSLLGKNTSESPAYLGPVEQDANVRAFKYFNRKIPGYNGWHFTGDNNNPITGYNNFLPYDDPSNQLALSNGKLNLSWYDFLMGPTIIVPGIVNTFILNRKY